MAYLQKVLRIINVRVASLLGLIVLFFFSSLIDLLGIGLIGPFILIVNDLTLLETTPLLKLLSSRFSPNTCISLIGIALVVVFLIRTFVGNSLLKIIYSFAYKRRSEIIHRMMKIHQDLPYIKQTEKTSSEVIHNLTHGVNYFILLSLIPIMQMTSGIAVFGCVFTLLMFTDVFATCSLLLVLGILIGIYDLFFRKKLIRCGRITASSQSSMIKAIQHAVKGFKEISLLKKEKFFRQIVDRYSDQFSTAAASASPLQQLPRYLIEFGITFFMVSFVLIHLSLGTSFVTIMSTLTVFGVAGMRLMPTINQFSSYLSLIRQSTEYVNLLYNELKAPPLEDIKTFKGIIPHNFQQISFTNVSYSYPNSKGNQLSNIHLNIQRGQAVAFIGKSGSGKTTLVDLLLGLLSPLSGEIKIDNHPLKEMISDWQSLVAYIPQNIFLLDTTVEANIALGIPSGEIDPTKLKNAIESAQLKEVIDQLPNGLQTRVGEDGIALSGGQKQRIGIARAFYFERELIVMDEATSALDKETEREIAEEIERLKGKKTLVIIAHRSKTIELCDKVFVLKNGKFVDVQNPLTGKKNEKNIPAQTVNELR